MTAPISEPTGGAEDAAEARLEAPRQSAPSHRKDHSYVWLATACGIAALLCIAGITSPDRIGQNFHLDVILILIALDRFADMLAQTSCLSVLARKAATATKGKPVRIAALLVGFLLLAGTVNNNITTCMLVLPAALVVLRAIHADSSTANRTTSMLLAAGNVAGASTPTGDFPALILVSAGAISYTEYVTVGTPLFLVTAAAIVAVYSLLLRNRTHPHQARFGFHLTELARRHERVNRAATGRLIGVFTLMIVGWIATSSYAISPAVIAWGGLALAGVAVRGTGVRLRLDLVQLEVPVKLAAILLASAAIAATGVVDEAATFIATTFHSPLTLVLAIMVVTTVAAGVADASAAAAGLLPLILRLTEAGQPLGELRPLTVIAYAAAVCAGSSLWTTSATAGQVLEQRIGEAGLEDPATRRPISFTWRSYAPLGAINCAVQFLVAAAYVSIAILVLGVGS